MIRHLYGSNSYAVALALAALTASTATTAKDLERREPQPPEPDGPREPIDAAPAVEHGCARNTMPRAGQYTDVRGCVRAVTVEVGADGVRHERDLLTRQGRKEWARQVEATRARSAKDGE